VLKSTDSYNKERKLWFPGKMHCKNVTGQKAAGSERDDEHALIELT